MPIQVVRKIDGKLKLTFGYDAELVAKVRGISGARFNKDGKYWTVPESSRVAVEQVIVSERIRQREMSIEMHVGSIGYGTYGCHASEAPERGSVMRVGEVAIHVRRVDEVGDGFVRVHYERATEDQVATLEVEEAMIKGEVL